MSESSILHNFIITDPEAIERFADAIEQSALDPGRKIEVPPYRMLEDPEEIAELMERWKKNHKH